MRAAHRHHPGYLAFLAHRLSGLALALFLPFHFLFLGTAIEGEAALEGALAWTANPLAKLAEWGLVTLLALHLALGLRVLAIEFLPWRGPLRLWVGLGGGAALATGLLFLAASAR